MKIGPRDKMGRVIDVDDIVVYATMSGQSPCIKSGVILDIKMKKDSWRDFYHWSFTIGLCPNDLDNWKGTKAKVTTRFPDRIVIVDRCEPMPEEWCTECGHGLESVGGGGLACTHCGYWFCY